MDGAIKTVLARVQRAAIMLLQVVGDSHDLVQVTVNRFVNPFESRFWGFAILGVSCAIN